MSGRHGDVLDDLDTGTWIAARILRDEIEASEAISSAQAGPGHARARRPRFPRLARLLRRDDPGPAASRLLADDGEPGTFTGIVTGYAGQEIPPEAFARPAAPAREDEAAARILRERADLPRAYAPSPASAIPWGMLDTPQNRQPARRYVPDLAADLHDLPAFREAVRRCTGCGPVPASAITAAAGDGMTWGERMTSRGTRLLSLPESATFARWPAAGPAQAGDGAGTGAAA